MKVYKFRSTQQIGFIFDILMNKRLYCADWKNLNDPMEGMFACSYREDFDVEQKVKGIVESKQKYKICSLSKTYDNHLLWAHYANGFDGVAIEIELPDDSHNIKELDYNRGVFAGVNITENTNEEDVAKYILFSKYNVWAYEEEIRILHDKSFYNNIKVTRVIAGHRVQDALFNVLNLVCNQLNIEFTKVGIGDEGIDVDFVKPLDLDEWKDKVIK